VYIPKELEPLILRVEKKLGVSRSSLLLIALMDYLKELDLLKEAVSSPFEK
jgi:hypothetical protein